MTKPNYTETVLVQNHYRLSKGDVYQAFGWITLTHISFGSKEIT